MKLKCPVCQNPNTKIKYKFKRAKINRCFNCNYEFINPYKLSQDNFYDEGYFKGGKGEIQGYKDYKILKPELEKEASKKLNLIQGYTPKTKLLDIGAGTGIFIEMAKKRGYQVSANDISPYALRLLKNRGIKTYRGSIDKNTLPKNKFEIVTAWDVIEHVLKPNKAIQSIYLALKPKGYLFMTTPDTESIDASLLGRYWYGYQKIPEHIGFHSKTSLSRLLDQNGFTVIDVKGWGFYRNLGFVSQKLTAFSKTFRLLKRILEIFNLHDKSFFIPLTDLIIVAQKK